MYGLTEGQGGTHTIEQSYEVRTVIPTTGKNKGKSPGFGKYQDMISKVANNILPLYRKQLDSTGKIPSGKQVAEVLHAAKLLYYDTRFALQSSTGKMSKEMPPAWTDHAWGCFVLFGPHGKQYAEFCAPTDDENAPTSRAASIAANNASKKREMSEIVGSAAVDRALDRAVFQDHNTLMAAKMMMKYGDAEDKANALAQLREFAKKGKENKTGDATPEEIFSIPFTTASHVPLPDGLDTAEVIGEDGLTWGQRMCRKVYESHECNSSANGFSPRDVVNKLNGKLSLEKVVEISDFLMSESLIFTTSVDDHYKGTNA
jgi:hypothetical protein